MDGENEQKEKKKREMRSIGVTKEIKELLDVTRDNLEKAKGERLSYSETIEELCRILLPKTD